MGLRPDQTTTPMSRDDIVRANQGYQEGLSHIAMNTLLGLGIIGMGAGVVGLFGQEIVESAKVTLDTMIERITNVMGGNPE